MRIGRVVRVLDDHMRKDELSLKDESRKIIVSIFYQTDKKWCPEKIGYYKDLYDPNKKAFVEMFTDGDVDKEKYVNNLRLEVYNEAPITRQDKTFPVVMYSPGMGMGRDFYMFNVEALVEAGYMVITIEHLHDSSFTVLPDGKVLEQSKIISKYTKMEFKQLVDIRKKDALFVLDQLDKINDNDKMVKGKLDLNKIGSIGHSMGAQSLFEAFNSDNRIKTLVIFDGSLQYVNLKDELNEGKKLRKYVLNFRKELNKYEERLKHFIEKNNENMDAERFKRLITGQHHTVIKQEEGQKDLTKYLEEYQKLIKLEGTEHMTFSDWYFFNGDLNDEMKASLRNKHNIINNVTVSFLNQYLNEVTEEYTTIIKNNVYSELHSLEDGKF